MREPSITRLSVFFLGFRDELPILVGVIPFGIIFAIMARQAGFSSFEAQAMSLVVFAGSAQFMLVQLAAANTPIPIMVLSGFIINLRHILYSASIAPFTKKLSVPWKIVLSYLLTDEAYAVTIAYFAKKTDTMRHYYFLGAGIALWGSWQLSTWVGLLVGSQIPSNWSLDFALPLTFIALVIPLIKDKPSLLAALSSGATALVTVHFPYKIGLLVSAFVGILIGLWSEKS